MFGRPAIRLGRGLRIAFVLALLSTFPLPVATARDFEGRITATLTRGTETQGWLYTVGTNRMRIERTETDWPYPKNIVDLNTGAITLVFPHNRSFVRLKPADQSAVPQFPGAPARPLPPGVGPQTSSSNWTTVPAAPPLPSAGLPRGVGPQAGGSSVAPGAPGMPAMPIMPPMPMEQVELKATGQTTNLLGYTCACYELKQRGEVMEIWATDKLLPFRAWMPSQPHRFGPKMVDEQWTELLMARKLFPLLATLKFENGRERMRFEVTAVTPQKIEDRDGALFQPPPEYVEIQPLPF
jgi:hypothetical protein